MNILNKQKHVSESELGETIWKKLHQLHYSNCLPMDWHIKEILDGLILHSKIKNRIIKNQKYIEMCERTGYPHNNEDVENKMLQELLREL